MTDKIIFVKEDEHSPLGPSSAERWINCPGSVAACAKVKDPGSDFALEGTAAHGLSEHCRHLGHNPQAYLGWTMRVQTGQTHRDFPVTQEMVDAVTEFIDRIDEEAGDDLCEARVRYDQFVPGGFGKLDAARMREFFAAITDLKYGKGVQVFATDHTQTKIYALGIYLDYNWLYQFKGVWLQICQPRLDHFDKWYISVEDLLKWAETVLKPAAERVRAGDTTRKAGDWCMFCRVKATCETHAKSIMEDVVGEFENLDEAVAKTETLEVSNLKDNGHVYKMLICADRVAKFFKAIKAYAMRELQQGNKIGEAKLVEGRSNRAWAADDTQVARRLMEAGAPESAVYKTTIVTPSQAEGLLGKAPFAPAKEATKRKPAQDPGPLAALVLKPKGKPKLALGSDPRPALVNVDPSDFENLDDEDYVD